MEKLLIETVNLLALIAVLSFPFFDIKRRGVIALSIISLQVVLNFIIAISVFNNGFVEYSYSGSWVTGIIPVRIDYLSAWFILIISFTFLTGAWYGIHYMSHYSEQTDNLTLHIIAFVFVHTSLTDICIIHNGFVMLVIWEIMALSSFLLIIFENNKISTLKAGINFLIQSHVSILFLTIGFLWAKSKTGSFDFAAITTYTATQPAILSVGLFICFFIGFAIKSGFVPFHTWLPLAHPAAPAHISGIMSGVIIKIGIYGILRMLLLIKTDINTIGYFILLISIITGIYGVMLAIIQHNLKKLLAYHSIENIGIIGIGIGLGCLGIGHENQLLIICGLGGALLHTLNHSLFKSLLFFVAGNIFQATHTMNIEALGGLIKQMPRSAYLFLIGSLAICGLPPFNGFVSEFFIYFGLFNSLKISEFTLTLTTLSAIIGLVIIGGLALICFTKAFGIVFLGTARQHLPIKNTTEKPIPYISLYFIALAILLIGIFPLLLNSTLQKIISLYQNNQTSTFYIENIFNNLSKIGWYSFSFIILIVFFYFIRYFMTKKRSINADETWGCGYTGNAEKLQYTASSFIRSYRKLAEPILQIHKEKKDATGLYPNEIEQITHPEDKLENWIIDTPIFYIKQLLSRFTFLQNGNIQAYILYGFIFIGSILLFPILINKLSVLINFLNQL